MLESIDDMTLKILKKCIFGVNTSRFSLFTQRYNGSHYVSRISISVNG